MTAIDDRLRRAEISLFLRTRRQRITPEEAGLPSVPRRRTPGLRREDVAQLAGVSFKWYTLFESGAVSRVSRTFLDAVASALRLTHAEKLHLLNLVNTVPLSEDTSPAMLEACRRLVDEVQGAPAALYSATFDVLACNDVYERVFRHGGQEGLLANKVWRVFKDPGFRGMWRHWERVAHYLTAELRFLNSAAPQSSAFLELLSALADDADFMRLWRAGDVGTPNDRSNRFELDLPEIGELTFDVVSLTLPGQHSLLFVTLIPVDEETRRRSMTLPAHH